MFYVEESKTIKEHINKGLLLPDELVLKFIVDELEKIRDKGFLLDGNNNSIKKHQILNSIYFYIYQKRLSTYIKSSWIIISTNQSWSCYFT